MKNKKVTAPLSYNPGKGRPQEYLAYLNWQEMEALKRLNGGNMEFGPRGLPSFADDSASSMGVSRPDTGGGNWTGAPGGTTTGTGTGTTNADGGDYNAGTDPGSWADGGDSGGSYPGGGPTSAPATSSSPSQSMSPPSSEDKLAMDTATANNNVEALKTPALTQDVGRPSYSYPSYRPPSDSQISGAISRLSRQIYRDAVPTSPGAGGGLGSLDTRRSSLLSPVGPSSGIEALGNVGPIRSALSGSTPGFPSSIDIKLPTSYPDAPSGKFGPMSPIKTYYPDAPQGSFGPRIYSPISRRPTDPDLERFSVPPAAPATLGYGGIPAATLTSEAAQYVAPEWAPYVSRENVGPLAEKAYNSVRDAVGNAYKAIGEYFSPSEPSVASGKIFPQDRVPEYPNDEKAFLTVSEIRDGVPTYFKSPGGKLAYEGPVGELSPSGIRALSEPSYRPYDVRYDQPSVVEVSGEPSISPSQDDVYPASQETILEVEDVPPEVPTEVYGPIYVDPEKQKLMSRYNRINQGVVRGILTGAKVADPTGIASLGLTALDKGLKFFTGSGVVGSITNPAANAIRALEQARTEEEKQAIRDRYPQVIAYEIAAGADVSLENRKLLQESKIAAGVVPPGAPIPGMGGSIYQGGTPVKEFGDKNPWWEEQYYTRRPSYSPSPSRSTTGSDSAEADTPLKKLYRQWDKGIGIPSRGDPLYNEYQKYLKTRDQEGTA